MVASQLSSNLLQGSCREILQTVYVLEEFEDEEILDEIEPEQMKLLFEQAGGAILVKIRKNMMRGNMSLQELCQKLTVNYTTTTNNVEKLKEQDWVKTREKGREKEIKLTDKGTKIAQKLMALTELVRAE